MDRQAFTLQSAQLTRPRNYVEDYELVVRHPPNAPAWAFKSQDIPPDTDYSAPNTPIIESELVGDDDQGKVLGKGDEEGGEVEGGDVVDE